MRFEIVKSFEPEHAVTSIITNNRQNSNHRLLLIPSTTFEIGFRLIIALLLIQVIFYISKTVFVSCQSAKLKIYLRRQNLKDIGVKLMKEKEHDRSLRIKTTGIREWLTDSTHHNRYEATPYYALDELFTEYQLKKTDVVIDFGCGKGRLPFYIHNRFGIAVAGIEVSNLLYIDALNNLASYLNKSKRSLASIRFECILAEKYIIKPTDNKFYFFNPFSTKIFMKVINNILLSVENHDRPVDVILYYPTPEYIQFIESSTPFKLFQEVRLQGLYEHNNNERFVIFRYNG